MNLLHCRPILYQLSHQGSPDLIGLTLNNVHLLFGWYTSYRNSLISYFFWSFWLLDLLHIALRHWSKPPEATFQANLLFIRYISTSVLLTTPKPLSALITTNCVKFVKRWEYQTTLPASWEICMQVKKQQLELDMEQQTGSKLGKENIKAVYCHPAHLTSMQSICETLGWKKHKLESRFLG